MIAPRTGRGTRLGRKERKEVWPVFEEYLLLLDEYKLREPADAMADARAILEGQQSRSPYRAILVDEAQDMGRQAFKLLRAMVQEGPHDLFIVGDAHQRIYGRKVVLGPMRHQNPGNEAASFALTTAIPMKPANGRVKVLDNLTIDDLDGGVDGTDAYTSLMHWTAASDQRLPDFEYPKVCGTGKALE
jgi:hypothetical protein